MRRHLATASSHQVGLATFDIDSYLRRLGLCSAERQPLSAPDLAVSFAR
jgi:hypothetical protein